MKSKFLALRIAANSAVMIFLVYWGMQSVVFLRDGLILGFVDWTSYVSSVFGFLGNRVLPPLFVFGLLLWWQALPFEKILKRLESGEILESQEVESVRNRVIRFKFLVLSINIIGFTVGFLLDIVLGNKFNELVQVNRLIILASNLAGAFVFSWAQTALNDLALAPLRDRLNIHHIDNKKRETSSTVRQLRISLVLVIYAALVIQYNQRDVILYWTWGDEIRTEVLAGRLDESEATNAWRALAKERLGLISSLPTSVLDLARAPWDRKEKLSDIQQYIFLLLGSFMFLITAFVQGMVAREHKSNLEALRQRIRAVVDGEGDLESRLALRSFDDLGDLADGINRLLNQFQALVKRIAVAAEETKQSSHSVGQVMSKAETLTQDIKVASINLDQELAKQIEHFKELTKVLDHFRSASKAVEAEVSTQNRLAGDTSLAMTEISGHIQSVLEKSQAAGNLGTTLASKGKNGREAVKELNEAITAIHTAAQEVSGFLGSINKIAAATNLLAMNAAIEAAHAGESGAGFAVVADEVRNLAATTSKQTKAIAQVMKTMEQQVATGVERSNLADELVSDLVNGLEQAAEYSTAVADDMQSQSQQSTLVKTILEQLVRTSKLIEDKVHDQERSTSDMAQSLNQASARVQNLVQAARQQNEVVASLDTSFTEVRYMVDRNAVDAEAVTKELDQFKT